MQMAMEKLLKMNLKIDKKQKGEKMEKRER